MPLSYVISYVIMASAATAGAIRYKRLSESSRWLLLLLILIFVKEILAYWVGHIYKTNLVIYHVVIPVQSIVLLKVYSFELKKYRRFIWGSMPLVLLASTSSLVIYRHQLTSVFPSALQNGVDIFSVTIILLYLRELINQPSIHPFGQYPLFWISVGGLFLVVLSTVSLGTFNYVSSNYATTYAKLFEQVRTVAEWQFYALFVVAFQSKQRSIAEYHE